MGLLRNISGNFSMTAASLDEGNKKEY